MNHKMCVQFLWIRFCMVTLQKWQGFEFDCCISRKFDVRLQSETPGMEIKQKPTTGCCDSNDFC